MGKGKCLLLKKVIPLLCFIMAFSGMKGFAGVIHINNDYSNINQFVDSLFDDDVRNFDQYKTIVFVNGKDRFFFSPEDEQKILNQLLNVWYNTGDTSRCPVTDKAFIVFLRNYIKQYGLCMFKPIISFNSTKEGIPVYAISGYRKYDIAGNREDTAEFLDLLLAGAHFVIIDGKQDSIGVKSFSGAFEKDASIETSANLGNSHYTSTVNLSGKNYLDISEDKAPNPCPFICSFIEAQTAHDKPNTFVQLEGWPASILHHDRHGKDYKTHEATKWNISTFGACAYSEKRATAIFISKPDWNPQLQSDTIMPHFRGADTPQGWLEKDLAIIVK